MGNDVENSIKKALKKMQVAFQKCEIWDDAKDYLRDELHAGEIVDITDTKTRKYYTCDSGFPSEYCSKENIEKDFYVVTSTGEKFVIKECAFGLNFEAPADSTIFYIYNENKEIIYPPEPIKRRKLIADLKK